MAAKRKTFCHILWRNILLTFVNSFPTTCFLARLSIFVVFFASQNKLSNTHKQKNKTANISYSAKYRYQKEVFVSIFNPSFLCCQIKLLMPNKRYPCTFWIENPVPCLFRPKRAFMVYKRQPCQFWIADKKVKQFFQSRDFSLKRLCCVHRRINVLFYLL